MSVDRQYNIEFKILAIEGDTIDEHRPAVGCGVAVVVTHANAVLIGRRVGGASAGLWQLPGGWIEAGESPPDAARREVREETGLELGEPRFVAVTSNVFAAGRHSISLYFEAECIDAAALAQGTCGWRWEDWGELGSGLFLPLELLRRSRYRPHLPGNSPTFFSF